MGDLYLAHHGILGMKWGIRRYQNPDGSLTEEGKRRLQKYNNRNAIEGARNKYYASKTDNVNKAASAARSITSQVRKNMSDRQRQADEAEKQKIRDSIDLSKMTDEELRSAINRLQMERQYKDLSMADVKASTEVQQGRDRIGRILDNMDTALAVGASAVALAGAIASLVGADFDSDSKSDKKKEDNGDKKKDSSEKAKSSNQSSKTSSSDVSKKSSGKTSIFSERTVTDKRVYGQDPLKRSTWTETDSRVYGVDPLKRSTWTETDSRVYGVDPLTRRAAVPQVSGLIYARGYDEKRKRGW